MNLLAWLVAAGLGAADVQSVMAVSMLDVQLLLKSMESNETLEQSTANSLAMVGQLMDQLLAANTKLQKDLNDTTDVSHCYPKEYELPNHTRAFEVDYSTNFSNSTNTTDFESMVDELMDSVSVNHQVSEESSTLEKAYHNFALCKKQRSILDTLKAACFQELETRQTLKETLCVVPVEDRPSTNCSDTSGSYAAWTTYWEDIEKHKLDGVKQLHKECDAIQAMIDQMANTTDPLVPGSCARISNKLDLKIYECSTFRETAKAETCDVMTAMRNVCPNLGSCYQEAQQHWANFTNITTTKEKQQKLQWRMLSRAKCLADAYDASGNVDKAKLDACASVGTYDTSHMNITYPAFPELQPCVPTEPSNVDVVFEQECECNYNNYQWNRNQTRWLWINTQCVKHFNFKEYWWRAERRCFDHGGVGVKVRSADELVAVNTSYHTQADNWYAETRWYLWTGGVKVWDDKEWMWADRTKEGLLDEDPEWPEWQAGKNNEVLSMAAGKFVGYKVNDNKKFSMTCSKKCLTGWKFSSERDKRACLKLVEEKVTQSAAQEKCVAMGATLMQYVDKMSIAMPFMEDQDNTKCKTHRVWVGLKKDGGVYDWADGNPQNGAISWGTKLHQCVTVNVGATCASSTRKYNTADCNSEFYFMCEKAVSSGVLNVKGVAAN